MEPVCTCELCELKGLFFDKLEGESRDIICSGKVEKEYAQGEIIIKEGMLIEDFTYLKSGLVKLYRSNNSGKEQIITIAKPFDYVSLLSVYSNSRYNYSVSALEDSVTCNIKMDDIKSILNENSNLALNLLSKMSNVADKIILDTLEIRRKQLKCRVAFLLIYFS